MPFVNFVSGFAERNIAESNKNCASCAAAGAICLLRHSHSAATVEDAQRFANQVLGVPLSGAFRMACSQEEQLGNIASYVKTRAGVNAIKSPPDIRLPFATEWMLSKSIGTVFVIAVGGILLGDRRRCAHILNAFHDGKRIVYIDFQSNRNQLPNQNPAAFAGHTGPATSDKPFVAVATQGLSMASSRNIHASTQLGSFEPTTTELTILAFSQR